MSIHEIVKAKFTELDVTDDDKIDEFIIAISQTDEYSSDVINEMDYDLENLLGAIATKDKRDEKEQIEILHIDIRLNAVNLYKMVIEDLEEQPSIEPEECTDADKRYWELHRDD